MVSQSTDAAGRAVMSCRGILQRSITGLARDKEPLHVLPRQGIFHRSGLCTQRRHHGQQQNSSTGHCSSPHAVDHQQAVRQGGGATGPLPCFRGAMRETIILRVGNGCHSVLCCPDAPQSMACHRRIPPANVQQHSGGDWHYKRLHKRPAVGSRVNRFWRCEAPRWGWPSKDGHRARLA